jgi:hypothetical protein
VGKARSSRGGKRAARVKLTERGGGMVAAALVSRWWGGSGGWQRPVRVPTARGRIRD